MQNRTRTPIAAQRKAAATRTAARWNLRFAIVAFALVLSPAHGELARYLSASWLLTGTCDSQDQVYQWTVQGEFHPADLEDYTLA